MNKAANKIKNYIVSRGVGYILTLPATVFAILAAVFYMRSGVTQFNPTLNSAALVCVWVGVALAAVSLVIDILPFEWAEDTVKPLRFIAYLLYLYAFLQFIMSQITYIANVLVAIDGSSLSSGFICTAVFYVLAFALTLVAACLNSWKPWKKEKLPEATLVEEGSEAQDEGE